MPGEIIAFTPGGETDVVQTHRGSQKINPNHNSLITKGDANAETDAAPVAV